MQITREQILAMEAGREMDALIAEYVMGWKYVSFTVYGHPIRPDGTCERMNWEDKNGEYITEGLDFDYCFSTDIAAAWQVVEKMQQPGDEWEYYFDLERTTADTMVRTIRQTPLWYAEFGGSEATGDTAPLAICRAALLATLESEPCKP